MAFTFSSFCENLLLFSVSLYIILNWVSSGLTDDKSVTKIIITYSPKMVLYKNIPLLTSCAWVGRWVTKLLMSERQPQKQLCSIQQLGHHCAGLLRTWRAMFLISGIRLLQKPSRHTCILLSYRSHFNYWEIPAITLPNIKCKLNFCLAPGCKTLCKQAICVLSLVMSAFKYIFETGAIKKNPSDFCSMTAFNQLGNIFG